MKIYFFSISFLFIILSSCKSDPNKQSNGRSIQKDAIASPQTRIQNEYKKETEEREKQIIIKFLKEQIQNVTDLIELYKNNIKENEPADQFGMKNGAFKIIIGNPSQKAYNDPKSQENRRQFYSSLNYDEDKIRQLGVILNQITSDSANRGQLHVDITNVGRAYSQFLFERAIDKLKEYQNRFDLLNFRDLITVKIKLKSIAQLRLLWQDTVNNIIRDYENDVIGIKTDSQKLIEHIRKQYGDVLKNKIPKIGIILGDLNKILKELN
ncbi:complement regulator-acquiring protein (plasmid) [Borrelia recurrentis]|uniref:complement regulator-acquiring protein n=1 Tax=Borrelia recurrentis TaxID=44449 RepID=UPI00366CB828